MGRGLAVDLRDGVGGRMSGSVIGGGKAAILTGFVCLIDVGGGERRTDGEGSEEVEVVAGEESSALVGEVKSIFRLTLCLDKGPRSR